MATVTRTYAQAFADVVFERGLDPAESLRQVQSLARLVEGNTELREVWETPSISVRQKRGVLDGIVAREAVSPPVRNFIAVLIDHSRINFLAAIAKAFEAELDRRLGFLAAEITSARDLDRGERERLEGRVAAMTGSQVRARYSLDRSMIGGAVVRMGSAIYDGSVKGQLERIRKQLTDS
jgi:F-type H+-transporting ATPase subunit delta